MYLFLKFYLFIYVSVGSSFLCEGFLQLRQVGATLHHGAWASHYRGLSCCGAQAPGAQAQQLWLTDLVAPQHVGSSQTRLKHVYPVLVGRFSTTAPPGKPKFYFILSGFCLLCFFGKVFLLIHLFYSILSEQSEKVG